MPRLSVWWCQAPVAGMVTEEQVEVEVKVERPATARSGSWCQEESPARYCQPDSGTLVLLLGFHRLNSCPPSTAPTLQPSPWPL